MSRSISVGVIGIGFGQQVHVPAFRTDPRCQVRAICASDSGRALKVAETLGIGQAYGDAHAMIADPRIDIISIAVPPAKQPALIEAAARAGKHVFCEKPLASDLNAAAVALDAVRRAGIKHAIDFLFPEIPAWQKAKELIPSLGTLRHASVSWKVETYAYKTGASSWKTQAPDGGGTLNSFVSHSVYYIEWLLGRINRVATRLSPLPSEARAEARVDAWMELTSGLPVSMNVAADAYLGSGHRIEIHGDNGTLVLSNASSDYVNGFELLVGTRDKAQLIQQVPPQSNKEDGRVTAAGMIVRRLVDSIISGHDARPGLEEGVRVQAVLAAMRLAHETGLWQIV